MNRHLVRAVSAAACLLLAASAAAQSNQLDKAQGPAGPVYANPSQTVIHNGGAPCIVGSTGCNLPTTDAVTEANTTPFKPTGASSSFLTASAFSANIALSVAATQVVVDNRGQNDVQVAFGGSGVTLTWGQGWLVPAGSCRPFTLASSATYMAAVTQSSTSNVSATPGTGAIACGGGGGGGGTVSGTVATTVADGSNAALGSTSDPAYNGSNTATLIAQMKALIAQMQASIPAGANVIGQVGIDQTTPGTSNAFQPIAGTTGGATPYYLVNTNTGVPAANVIKGSAGTLMTLLAENVTSVVYYVHVYDSASPTCGNATGLVHVYAVPANNNNGAGFIFPIPVAGEAYANGISYFITGGSAPTDCTPAGTGVLINGSFK